MTNSTSHLEMVTVQPAAKLNIDGDFPALANMARLAIGWDGSHNLDFRGLATRMMIDEEQFVKLLQGHRPAERVLDQFAHMTSSDAVLLRLLANYNTPVGPRPNELGKNLTSCPVTGTKIRNNREGLGFLRSRLADVVGVDENTIRELEAGLLKPDSSTAGLIIRVARELKVDPLALVDCSNHELYSKIEKAIKHAPKTN